MSGSRLKLGPLAAVMGTPLEEQQAAKPRANRLSRSSRQRLGSEQDSPRSQRAGEQHLSVPLSPHNESDFQQDIIWDATSPSPNRRGKRGKTRPAGAVSISEIVNRIAPKHGRPEDTDPTLQQWIGDSATIPCTPDVQPPKPKKKPNAVDDLLKLAKQFDFNMFRRDEEAIEVSPSLHGSRLPAASVVAGTGVRLLPDQHTDDDLDFLFDGPTQHVSGNLSQACSAQSQVKPPREASGKPCVSSLGPTSAVSTPHGNATSARDDFEDDWGDDDLLNDSLVLEMTQNPLKFASPKLCSTQKPAGPARRQREAEPAVGLGQSAATRVEKENVRIQNARRQAGCSSSPAGRGAVQSASSPRRAGQTCRLNSVKLQKPASDQRRTSAGICRAAASQTTNAPNFPQEASFHSTPPADGDFLDDDLDAFFLSEPVWDDLADDELLCDMCEELESQIQGVAEKRAPLIGQIPNQSAALRPTAGGRSGPPRCRERRSNTPSKTNSPSRGRLTRCPRRPTTVRARSVVASCVFARVKRFRAVCMTDFSLLAGRGKCSPAEIERKKQQAMARRRQRLQAAQNLRGVT
uniref:ETAA1 activator of ATR kinase a n=1 Tax=Neolamprologus brichardi TaxID=32507 RepID=A0A3Q4HS70_NEOBR